MDGKLNSEGDTRTEAEIYGGIILFRLNVNIRQSDKTKPANKVLRHSIDTRQTVLLLETFDFVT